MNRQLYNGIESLDYDNIITRGFMAENILNFI